MDDPKGHRFGITLAVASTLGIKSKHFKWPWHSSYSRYDTYQHADRAQEPSDLQKYTSHSLSQLEFYLFSTFKMRLHTHVL